MDERIRTGQTQDGTAVTWVEGSPEALPPVRSGELLDAWLEATRAATEGRWGRPRLIRFDAEAGATDILLLDHDACCWAAALDRHRSLATRDGLALCLRLLALIHLLTRAPWASFRTRSSVDPALLRLAAVAPLTAGAEFDECFLRRRLHPVPAGGETDP